MGKKECEEGDFGGTGIESHAEQIECESESNSGEAVGANELANIHVVFKGCLARGEFDAQNEGANTGEIIVNTLKGKLGYINKGEHKVGVLLEPSEPSTYPAWDVPPLRVEKEREEREDSTKPKLALANHEITQTEAEEKEASIEEPTKKLRYEFAREQVELNMVPHWGPTFAQFEVQDINFHIIVGVGNSQEGSWYPTTGNDGIISPITPVNAMTESFTQQYTVNSAEESESQPTHLEGGPLEELEVREQTFEHGGGPGSRKDLGPGRLELGSWWRAGDEHRENGREGGDQSVA